MGRELLMLVLLFGLIAVAAAIFTVVFEMLTYRRKQDKYDALHRGMGLDPEGSDIPSSEER